MEATYNAAALTSDRRPHTRTGIPNRAEFCLCVIFSHELPRENGEAHEWPAVKLCGIREYGAQNRGCIFPTRANWNTEEKTNQTRRAGVLLLSSMRPTGAVLRTREAEGLRPNRTGLLKRAHRKVHSYVVIPLTVPLLSCHSSLRSPSFYLSLLIDPLLTYQPSPHSPTLSSLTNPLLTHRPSPCLPFPPRCSADFDTT